MRLEIRRRIPCIGRSFVAPDSHGTLRIGCAGSGCGPLSESQLDGMERTLDESLAAGACGLSTGLMYAPGESAPFAELERLCRIVARRGKLYATHRRDYAFRVVEAVEEQLGSGADRASEG
jgi:N-acyl-D-amino-acid deacylase